MSYPSTPRVAAQRETTRRFRFTAPFLVGILTLVLGILPGTMAQALTEVNLDITVDTVWLDDVYYVSGDILVAPGVTLRIPAGTVVKFRANTMLLVEDALLVDGTALAGGSL